MNLYMLYLWNKIKWWQFTTNFDLISIKVKCTIIPKTAPIHCLIVTFIYHYGMKILVMLLQDYVW